MPVVDPDSLRIRIHIKVISWIRINLQMTSQNAWKMSLFQHFFKGFGPLFGSYDLDPDPDPDPH
jgi:hypothetical protein